jgi:hypothetical protein
LKVLSVAADEATLTCTEAAWPGADITTTTISNRVGTLTFTLAGVAIATLCNITTMSYSLVFAKTEFDGWQTTRAVRAIQQPAGCTSAA